MERRVTDSSLPKRSGQADDDLGEIRQGCVGAGGAECTEGGAVVAHGGEGHAQGVHESKAVKHHAPAHRVERAM